MIIAISFLGASNYDSVRKRNPGRQISLTPRYIADTSARDRKAAAAIYHAGIFYDVTFPLKDESLGCICVKHWARDETFVIENPWNYFMNILINLEMAHTRKLV